MSEITVGSYVRLLVDLCDKEHRAVLVPKGSLGIVDDIDFGDGNDRVQLDVILEDIHFALFSDQVEIITNRNLATTFPN